MARGDGKPCEITYVHPDYLCWCGAHGLPPEDCIRNLEGKVEALKAGNARLWRNLRALDAAIAKSGAASAGAKMDEILGRGGR